MFDNEFSIPKKAKATLVSLVCPSMKFHTSQEESERSIAELRELLRTLDIICANEFIQNRKTVAAGTIIGSGKLKEIASLAKTFNSDILVFDCELTATQIRNIKKLTKMAIVDRYHVILEIFARHARTKEAKIQIEIARLEYILPRLSGFWTHLGRQRGGTYVKGGEGEQQIELDRRIIRDRIKFYKKELKHVITSRKEQRKRREKKAVTAALVGYTNAGKSSIMNRLCKVNVLEEDQLFATLDATYRTLNPDTKPPMILIDTVGFISNLPNTLIDGFKTTLESTLEADLLLIICDISDPDYKKHLMVTKEVLSDLGVNEKNQIIIFNKKDLLKNNHSEKIIARAHPDSFVVSSFDEKEMNELREYIINYFLKKQEPYELFIPYDDGPAHSKVLKNTNILNRVNHEKGIFYKIKSPQFIFSSLGMNEYILSPEDPILRELDW